MTDASAAAGDPRVDRSRKIVPIRAYEPVGGRLIIKPDKPEERNVLIQYAEQAKKRPLTGTIVVIDPDIKDPRVAIGKKCAWGEMFEIKCPVVPEEGDRIVLRYPQEVLFLYADAQRQETDEEMQIRVQAEERFYLEQAIADENTRLVQAEREKLREKNRISVGHLPDKDEQVDNSDETKPAIVLATR